MEVVDGRRRRGLYIAHGGCQSPSAPRYLGAQSRLSSKKEPRNLRESGRYQTVFLGVNTCGPAMSTMWHGLLDGQASCPASSRPHQRSWTLGTSQRGSAMCCQGAQGLVRSSLASEDVEGNSLKWRPLVISNLTPEDPQVGIWCSCKAASRFMHAAFPRMRTEGCSIHLTRTIKEVRLRMWTFNCCGQDLHLEALPENQCFAVLNAPRTVGQRSFQCPGSW